MLLNHFIQPCCYWTTINKIWLLINVSSTYKVLPKSSMIMVPFQYTLLILAVEFHFNPHYLEKQDYSTIFMEIRNTVLLHTWNEQNFYYFKKKLSNSNPFMISFYQKLQNIVLSHNSRLKNWQWQRVQN